MDYQSVAAVGSSADGWALELGEGRRAYRRSWYHELGNRFGEHPVTARAEQRVKRGQGAARWRSILALSQRLAEAAPAELRDDWLTFEELLHAHWLAVAAAHYNLGVEAGLRRSALDAAGDDADTHERIRGLVEALSKLVAKL